MQAFRVMKKIGAISTGVAMLGATITGAMALDLAEYPSPFVMNGNYDNSNVFVVGANAAASDSIGVLDIGAGLQFESKVCTSGGGTVTISGGVTEEITLGEAIADTTSQTLDQELQDDDIDTLLDSTMTFQSSDYDFQEILVLGQAGNNVTVETSLTSSEDDYQTDIVLEIGKDAVKYYYAWDEAIAIDNATTSEPLEIKFLGKTLKLTNVASGGSKFTAYVGNEYFLNVDDSVEVAGKTVTLKNVGSGGAIVVDVDGVTETISSSSTETVNGIEISNDETFYDSNDVSQRSATLIVGEDAQETYTDGDAYVGEDKDDPDWVWNIGNLNTNSATTTSTTGEFSGPYIGVENDFVYNDDSDNPPGIGECIDLPNDYLSICLDSLTVADDKYATYYFELDTSADLSDAFADNTSVNALYIHTSVDEGIEVMRSNLDAANGSTTDVKSKEAWVYHENETDYMLFYKDPSDSKVKLAGSNVNGTTKDAPLRVNYDSTKGTDLKIHIQLGSDSAAEDYNITVVPYDSTYLSAYNDNITMQWGIGSASSPGITSLGSTASSEEADELIWNEDTTIGTKDEDHRTRYGIIIRDPKSNGASDQVVLDIPANQVRANVVVKGSSATTSTSGGSCTIAEINPKSMLDSEISDATAYNLIVVGGPCANSMADEVFGMTCSDWPYKAGEGVVKLVANGNKAAMLVAGTTALDTRRTAKAIKDYKSYAFSGTEAVVKGTTLSDITVE